MDSQILSQRPLRRWRGHVLVALLLVGGFAGGFLVVQARLGSTVTGTSQPATRHQAGTELLMVFAVSSTCGAARNPTLPGAVRDIRKAMKADAERAKKRFVSVGLLMDQEPWNGITFLKQFGPFDEVLSGGGWMNTGSLAFIVRDLPGERAIPQLIFVERDVDMVDSSISTVADRLVGRKIGADAIVTFARGLGPAQAGGAGAGNPHEE